MANSPLQGFITKKDVAERFDRSHRSLTRDLSAAVRSQDIDVLQNLRLRTDDGKIQEGTEVSLEMIQDMSNRGLTPTWYLLESWVKERYGEDAQRHQTQDALPDRSQLSPEMTDSRTTEVESLLRERIRELERDKDDLREELQIKNEQIGQANERGKETNVLMRDIHQLMGDMQNRLLPLPRNASGSESIPAVINPVEDSQATASALKDDSKTGSVAKSQRPSKKKSTAGRKQPQKKTDKQEPKWYEIPTVNRFLNRQ
jgi:hypothetical protein